MSQRKNETREEYLARCREYLRKKRDSPEYKEVGRLKHNAYIRAYYRANKAKVLAQQKKRREKNHEEYLAKKRVYSKVYRQKKRREAIAAYGDCCACCGETIPEFLGIDHMNNDGGKHIVERYGGKKRLGGLSLYRWLKDNGYPPGFQILCHNCNMAKGFYGSCPHQRS